MWPEDRKPPTNEELAREALFGVLKIMTIKWAIIVVLNRLGKRSAK